MMVSTLLPTMAAIAVASTAGDGERPVAVVDAVGQIQVSHDGGHSWDMIHACHPPDATDTRDRLECAGYPQLAAITWMDDELYVACSGASTLWRWRADTARGAHALSVGMGPIHALASRAHELVIGDARGGIWALGPDQRPRAIATAPEPIHALAVRDTVLAGAGPSAVWTWSPSEGVWRPVTPARVCALAWTEDRGTPRLWSAGPDGLIDVTRGRVRVHHLAPTTGIAASGAGVIVADGETLAHVSATTGSTPHSQAALTRGTLAVPERRASPGELARLRRRARWASTLPRLGASARWTRAINGRRSWTFWLWLTWSPPAEVSLP